MLNRLLVKTLLDLAAFSRTLNGVWQEDFGTALEQFVRLRKMLLQETRAIREISRKAPFEKPIRLLISVSRIGVTQQPP